MRTYCLVSLFALSASEALAWAPANARLMTEFGEKVTPANAWREYPRPQMARANWTCLNGLWDYAVVSNTWRAADPGRDVTVARGEILVPFPIESALSGVGRLTRPDELIEYRRTFRAAPAKGKRLLLNFEQVDFRAQVFVNGVEAGVPHEGGQVPFSYDVTGLVKDGANDLLVRVWDPTQTFVGSCGKQHLEPKGCFYTRASGICGTVWIEEVPETHLVSYRVTPDLAAGTVSVTLCGAGDLMHAHGTVKALRGGKTFAEGALAKWGEPIVLALPKPVAEWTPETPELYDLEISFGAAGAEADVVKGYFGMRSFEKRRDKAGAWRFHLNGRPFFAMGTLDQGWWPDGLLVPPSEEAMAHDILTLKRCGYNTMRKHIKVEPRRYYALCDRLGLVVLQDMPSTDSIQIPTKDVMARQGLLNRYGFYRHELKEVIDHLYNVPSIVMWVPYNEGWGQPGETLTRDTQLWVKRYDPSRLVNGPSGWYDYEGGESIDATKGWKRFLTKRPADGSEACADVVDKHSYPGPDMIPVQPDRVSFLGEYGGIGFKMPGHLWDEQGGGWGYVSDTNRAELAARYATLADKMRHLARTGLSGAIYTQTTDVEKEINGLMTYDRKVLKFDPAVLKAAHENVRGAFERGCVEWPAEKDWPNASAKKSAEMRRTQWENSREEVLDWFRENFYGRAPVGRPADEQIGERSVTCAGGKVTINLHLSLPKGADAAHPVPVFVLGDHCVKAPYGGIPTNSITARGYAYVCYNFNDVAPDRYIGDPKRIDKAFAAYGGWDRPDGWAKVGAWAWGFSRVMDWIETRPELDAKRVAVVGHSRGGKTALWAAAQDKRIAMAVSNNSGTGGAHLNESVTPGSEQVYAFRVCKSWNFFCDNFLKFDGRETTMEHDADDLLRLIAPRLVYVASASEDAGAGPQGEFEAARRAGELWEAYGLKGLSLSAYPAPDTKDHSGHVGFHLRPGGHKLLPYDWERFMDFADLHLKEKAK